MTAETNELTITRLSTSEPPLFKGNDFGRTDIEVAVLADQQ